MTAQHARRLRTQAPTDGDAAKVRMYRSFDPSAPSLDLVDESELDVEDPWYGGHDDFLATLEQVEAAADAIVAHVRAALRPEDHAPGGRERALPPPARRPRPIRHRATDSQRASRARSLRRSNSGPEVGTSTWKTSFTACSQPCTKYVQPSSTRIDALARLPKRGVEEAQVAAVVEVPGDRALRQQRVLADR